VQVLHLVCWHIVAVYALGLMSGRLGNFVAKDHVNVKVDPKHTVVSSDSEGYAKWEIPCSHQSIREYLGAKASINRELSLDVGCQWRQ